MSSGNISTDENRRLVQNHTVYAPLIHSQRLNLITPLAVSVGGPSRSLKICDLKCESVTSPHPSSPTLDVHTTQTVAQHTSEFFNYFQNAIYQLVAELHMLFAERDSLLEQSENSGIAVDHIIQLDQHMFGTMCCLQTQLDDAREEFLGFQHLMDGCYNGNLDNTTGHEHSGSATKNPSKGQLSQQEMEVNNLQFAVDMLSGTVEKLDEDIFALNDQNDALRTKLAEFHFSSKNRAMQDREFEVSPDAPLRFIGAEMTYATKKADPKSMSTVCLDERTKTEQQSTASCELPTLEFISNSLEDLRIAFETGKTYPKDSEKPKGARNDRYRSKIPVCSERITNAQNNTL